MQLHMPAITCDLEKNTVQRFILFYKFNNLSDRHIY